MEVRKCHGNVCPLGTARYTHTHTHTVTHQSGGCALLRKTWGIENFVSSTLLRNMREKDLRKAVGYHMKKSQSQQDPKQKGLSFNQARINYLEELSDLKSFGGKSFSATMLVRVTDTQTERQTHRQSDSRHRQSDSRHRHTERDSRE